MPSRDRYPPLPDVLTASEVAAAMRVSKATIARLASSGRLTAMPLTGRLLFLADEVALFMKRARHTPPPPADDDRDGETMPSP